MFDYTCNKLDSLLLCKENQNTQFIHNIVFSPSIVSFMRQSEKCGAGRQDIDDNITRRMRIAGLINKAKDSL